LLFGYRVQYDSGVDSASNKNEYQEYFLGVKDRKKIGQIETIGEEI
jgi:hypothetical protein